MADQVKAQPINEANPASEPNADAGANHQMTLVAIDRLIPYKGNTRKHPKKQIEQIAASIRRFGFNAPVLIDDDGTIIVGHGRVAAAKLLGLSAVPTLRISHLSPAEKRAYAIADNRLAQGARWDRDALTVELQALVDVDFAVELTGFDAEDVALILDHNERKTPKATGASNACSRHATVSRPGDVWLLGDHQLVCGHGDTADVDVILQQWQVSKGEQATLASTSHTFAEVGEQRATPQEAR